MPGPFNAPPSFVDGAGRRIVFAKIHQADYKLTFTPEEPDPEALAESTIRFTTYEDGDPVIDLYVSAAANITAVELDGVAQTPTVEVGAPVVDSAGNPITKYRVLRPAQPVPAGDHVLMMKHKLIDDNVKLEHGGVICSFDTNDREEPYLPERQRHPFLERYLPCNLEFDQHPVSLRVKVIGAVQHKVFTNSETRIDFAGGNEWLLTYPEKFTSSSMFFLLAPGAQIDEHAPFSVGSVAVTLFATKHGMDLAAFADATRTGLEDLIARGFGPLPFPRLILHATDNKGMEYAGAAAVSPGSLRHELVHQYAGRCLLPVNGDAGWVDEGVASWFEFGGLGHPYPPGERTNIGERSPYHRITDRRAWTQGKVMMSYLHNQLQAHGGVASLIYHLITVRRLAFVPLTARQFQAEIEAFAGRSFEEEFQRAIYAK